MRNLVTMSGLRVSRVSSAPYVSGLCSRCVASTAWSRARAGWSSLSALAASRLASADTAEASARVADSSAAPRARIASRPATSATAKEDAGPEEQPTEPAVLTGGGSRALADGALLGFRQVPALPRETPARPR